MIQAYRIAKSSKLIAACAVIFVSSLPYATPARADYTIEDIAPFEYVQSPSAEGSLLTHISFDDIGSSVAVDSSGNGNDAILSDDAVWLKFDDGAALSLDDTNDRAIIPNDIIGMGPVTVSLRYSSNSQTQNAVLFGNGAFSISLSDGDIAVTNDRGSHTVVGSVKAVPGEWHDITVAREGSGEVRIYIDGALIAGGFAGEPIGGFVVSIGNSPWDDGTGFDGMIDDIAIYSGIVKK